MNTFRNSSPLLLATFLLAPAANAQNAARGTLLSNDFSANSWPAAQGNGFHSKAEWVRGEFGTIDVAGGTRASGGLRGSAQPIAGKAWAARFSSGVLPMQNKETNGGKLTLAFSLSANAARPVAVRVESFDSKKKRSGALETIIYPAAPVFYQRYALDLTNFKAQGKGKFAPDAPFVQFSFALDGEAWKGIAAPQIQLDNVHFARPAFYVSQDGKDTNDGRSEATAFATPQKAVDSAGPGDIIAVMNGTYLPVGIQDGVVRFQKTGAPAAWISLKNYPGHKPMFSAKGTWGAIRWFRNAAHIAAMTPAELAVAPSYIEVRGLHIRGEGDVAKEKYADLVGKAAPETNGNGISVGWTAKHGDAVPHHLRFADNLVEFCPGGGIGPGQADWIYIENNVVRNNCWTTIYGTSGISLNHGSNFDGTSGGYRILIRDNITNGNRTFVAWKQVGKISDGNGIIVDVNQESKMPEEQRFNGRTLIQNNLSFNNGGSGIHSFKSARVDIINNTVYMNSASPELTWGQLFVQQSEDIRMMNNIVVAPDDQPVNTVGTSLNDQNSKNIVREGNLYFGGGTKPIMGETDKVGDPQFVNASIDQAIADFHLRPASPALNAARIEPFSPIRDLDGTMRGAKPSIGVYEK